MLRRQSFAMVLAFAGSGLAIATAVEEAPFPLDQELEVLQADLDDPDYLAVLKTMISTDLAAEWQRIGTPDNYLRFAESHGGLERVNANAELRSAYRLRKEIAERFLALMRETYAAAKREPPFDEDAIREVLLSAGTERKTDELPAIPVRVLTPAPESERYWPRLRGFSGQGQTSLDDLPCTWSDTENIRWRSPLPGVGNSSPIVWGDRLYVTAAPEDGRERHLVCLDIRDGAALWTRTLTAPGENVEKLYWKNTYASPTPITDGERVFVFLGNAGLHAFDFDGNRLWSRDLGEFPTMHGPGTSPVVYQNLVILLQDQTRGETLFEAFDVATGETVWKATRPNSACWSTPVLLRVGDRDELVHNGSHEVVGYDPRTGVELWRCSGTTRESIPSIVVGDHRLYSTSGRNGPTLAIRPGGNGDVSETHLLWRMIRGGPHVPSPVFHSGHLYQVNDTGILTCLNATDGGVVWQNRLQGRFSMSPLLFGEKLLVTNEDGLSFVAKASPEYNLLAEYDLKVPIRATPAVVGERLYFRTHSEILCVGRE